MIMLWSFLLTLSVFSFATAEKAPVLLWGAKTAEKSAFETIDEKGFANLVGPLLKDHMIVAFLERDLTLDKFSCPRKLETAETCFKTLSNEDVRYYTKVLNASKVLNSIAIESVQNTIDEAGNLKNPIDCKAGKVISVTFADNENQPHEQALQQHDAAVGNVIKNINCDNVKVVYLYLSAPGPDTSELPLSRRRRAVTTSSDNEVGPPFRYLNKFLIYYKSLEVGADEVKLVKMTVAENATDELTVTFDTSNGKQLVFDIVTYNDGYAYMKDIIYNGVKYRNPDVNAPTTFSYYCGQLKLYPKEADNGAQILNWTSLQFRAPFDPNAPDDFNFADAWHCVGFVTPGILSVLFVALLLVVILFVAVCCIMDINTMDRFDDPKGKTITINTTASD